MEWWEAEDVLADMRERPSVQTMVQVYLGVKPRAKARTISTNELVRKFGRKSLRKKG